jgi:hypothetical protein
MGQTDKPFGIDDPVPWKLVLAAHGVENSGNLSRAVGMTGHEGDAPIGADFTFGDAFYYLDYRSCKRFHYTPRLRQRPSTSCVLWGRIFNPQAERFWPGRENLENHDKKRFV